MWGSKGKGKRGNGNGRPRRRAAASGPAYAAVDLGTNNCRLLIATPDPTGFRVIDSFSRVVRLGEGLAASGRLSEAAIARTVRALKICAGKIHANGVRQVRSVATEACRQAANCRDFLARVKRQTGLTLEPITAHEEACLTLAGCLPLLDDRFPRVLICDIGGGSTELTWIAQDADRRPAPLGVLSLPFGVVTLAERYGGDILERRHYEEIMARVDDGISPFCAEHGIAGAIADGNVQLVGTSGTVTMLGGIHLGLGRYDRTRVDGLDMDFASIAAASARLAAMDWETRAAHPCIRRDRADLVIMGCAILEAVCRRWPVGRLRIADRGIREGLLLDMMGTGRAAPQALRAAASRAAAHP